LEYTRFAWAGGTFFPVVLLCRVSFWFWWEIGFVVHTHVLRVQYSCGVVLVFWLRREIVFGVMYNLVYNTVKLLCQFFEKKGTVIWPAMFFKPPEKITTPQKKGTVV
jgi:hypothetical protein